MPAQWRCGGDPVDQQQLTVEQFGARAASYLNSAVHSKGADLDRLTELVGKTKPGHVLDLGCGAGHASFAAAVGEAQRVIAYDPSADMLAVVAAEGARRGFTNLETQAGAAERSAHRKRKYSIQKAAEVRSAAR